MFCNIAVPGFRALPGFIALKAVDGPSALNPGTTVLESAKTNLIYYFFFQIRFLCAPKKVPFFFGAMNLVDLFAILPFFLDLIIGGLQVRKVVIETFPVQKTLMTFNLQFIGLILVT